MYSQRETILLKELEKVRIPRRVFTFSMRIWFPGNWTTVRIADDEESVVPTVFADKMSRSPVRKPATPGVSVISSHSFQFWS